MKSTHHTERTAAYCIQQGLADGAEPCRVGERPLAHTVSRDQPEVAAVLQEHLARRLRWIDPDTIYIATGAHDEQPAPNLW